MEHVSLLMPLQNHRDSLQTEADLPSLYSKKKYMPYRNSWQKKETATTQNLLRRSSGISGVKIIKTWSSYNDGKTGRKGNGNSDEV